jgi:predicted transcriptional regulator of viral defense system
MAQKTKLAEWIEALPVDGRYTFTRAEAEVASGSSFVAVQSALRRLKKKKRIASPWRGFYVFVPPEYRTAGAPPASWFIDDLMRYCDRRYYIGLLTAAALHGAGHQQPMIFQVFADRTTPEMQIGGARIKVYSCRRVSLTATVQLQTETGTMTVSSPETTAFDLVRFPEEAGYWSNVATVLAELANKLTRELLLETALHRKLPDSQRLGFLLALLKYEQLATPIAQWLSKRRTSVVRLRNDKSATGFFIDKRFKVIVNEAIEPDL